MTDDAMSGARDAVIDRYSGLARTALAGGTPVDCEPDAFADGCFGAAAYTGAAGVPEAALRASPGCGATLDDQRHELRASAASVTAVVALAQAGTVMMWDPANQTLIVANVVGQMPWTVQDGSS